MITKLRSASEINFVFSSNHFVKDGDIDLSTIFGWVGNYRFIFKSQHSKGSEKISFT